MTGAVPLVRAQPPIKRAKGPHRGHSPGNFLFASGRAEPCLTSGGEAGTKMAKSSKTTHHIGRRSRSEEGQICEDDSSHQAAKAERRWPNLRRRLITSDGEAGTKMAKSSKTTHHIGRRSRNENGQIFEDDSHIGRRSRNEDGQIFEDDSHIGRRSRNEDGQIFEDDSLHRAAKPERKSSSKVGAKIVEFKPERTESNILTCICSSMHYSIIDREAEALRRQDVAPLADQGFVTLADRSDLSIQIEQAQRIYATVVLA